MLWLLPLVLGIDTCYSVGWDSMGNYTEEGDSYAAFVALQLIYPSVTYVRCRGTRMRFHLHGVNTHVAVDAAARCLVPSTRGMEGYTERECATTDYKPRMSPLERATAGFIFGMFISVVLICTLAYSTLHSNDPTPSYTHGRAYRRRGHILQGRI